MDFARPGSFVGQNASGEWEPGSAEAGLTQTRSIARKSPLEAATTVTTTVRTGGNKKHREHDKGRDEEVENSGVLRGPGSPRSARSPRGAEQLERPEERFG